MVWVHPSFETLDLSFLNFLTFIATIAATVQVVEMTLDRFMPGLVQRAWRVPSTDCGELRHFGLIVVHGGTGLQSRPKHGVWIRFGRRVSVGDRRVGRDS